MGKYGNTASSDLSIRGVIRAGLGEGTTYMGWEVFGRREGGGRGCREELVRVEKTTIFFIRNILTIIFNTIEQLQIL